MIRALPQGKWSRAITLALLLLQASGCQVPAAQIYIPAAYAVTGLCVALLVSPTPAAAVAGLILGGLLGAAVYNNSLKRGLTQMEGRAAPRR